MGLSYDARTQVYVFTQRGVALDNFEKFGVLFPTYMYVAQFVSI